jgi:signal transduction histidine kinase
MFGRGLKTKMAINIAILLFMAMFLINIVAVVTAQRDLIQAEISKGDLLLLRLQKNLVDTPLWRNLESHSGSKARITQLLDETDAACALIMGRDSGQLYFGENQCDQQNELDKFTHQAIVSGKRVIRSNASIWGVFWSRQRNLILALPVIQDGTSLAATGIVLPLDRIYERLRRSQKIFFVYILINTIILTFAGIYRLSKVYFQPLARLARRAEEYRDDDVFIFTVRKEDNELNTLSKALNSMLQRISDDKRKLLSTVASLEKANLQLKKAQEDIIRAEKLASVGRLSAGIAHEIGNPIGIVMGYLELIKQKDIPPDEKNEYIHRTEKEIDRINTIIRQLLEVSRPSNAGVSAIAVHDLIDEITDVLKVQPLISNIEFEINLNAEDSTVLVDPNQLRQVFLNLIINAADAISSMDKEVSGRLRIITELVTDSESDPTRHAPMIKILFIDNGPGIPPNSIANIFDPFFTTKEPGKGTGLGLSVSFMIVEGFGGKMTVSSEVDKGTTMEIYLPLYNESSQTSWKNICESSFPTHLVQNHNYSQDSKL